MRKGLVVLLAAVVVATFAVPAMAAGVDVSGYYRAKGYVSNFKALGAASTNPQLDNGQDVTYSYVEQRIRMKFAVGDENVKAVWFAELDPNFGIGRGGTGTNQAARNQGGGLGADLIDVETKNAYLWFKVPDTTLDFTVGLQNQSDSFAGVIFGAADFAGAFANFKIDPVALRLGWGKLAEGNVSQSDDIDLYVAEAKFAPTADLKLGLDFYFIHDGGTTDFGGVATPTGVTADGPKSNIYTPGIDLTAKAGPATISAFALYQFGTLNKDTAGELDIAGYAVDVRADLALGPGKLFVEGLYVSGDDDATDTDFNSIKTLGSYVGSQDFYNRTDMQLLFSNADDLSTNQPITTNVNFQNLGKGVIHLAAGYGMKFTDKVSGKVGAGWLSVAEKAPTDTGSSVAVEVNANVNYNIAKGLDFGLYGAYAFLGDYYDVPERVDPYDLHFRLNYAF